MIDLGVGIKANIFGHGPEAQGLADRGLGLLPKALRLWLCCAWLCPCTLRPCEHQWLVNIDIARNCQYYFGFKLPSELWSYRVKMFDAKYMSHAAAALSVMALTSGRLPARLFFFLFVFFYFFLFYLECVCCGFVLSVGLYLMNKDAYINTVRA